MLRIPEVILQEVLRILEVILQEVLLTQLPLLLILLPPLPTQLLLLLIQQVPPILVQTNLPARHTHTCPLTEHLARTQLLLTRVALLLPIPFITSNQPLTLLRQLLPATTPAIKEVMVPILEGAEPLLLLLIHNLISPLHNPQCELLHPLLGLQILSIQELMQRF